MKATNKYDDIINLPHHVSKTRPQMSISDRAAQFSPFAALTGHSAAIKETERLTDRKVELSENEKSILNEKFSLIMEQLSFHPELSVTYFVPDEKKDGGKYVTTTGKIKKIDYYQRKLIMDQGVEIPIGEIYEIDGSLFGQLDF